MYIMMPGYTLSNFATAVVVKGMKTAVPAVPIHVRFPRTLPRCDTVDSHIISYEWARYIIGICGGSKTSSTDWLRLLYYITYVIPIGSGTTLAKPIRTGSPVVSAAAAVQIRCLTRWCFATTKQPPIDRRRIE